MSASNTDTVPGPVLMSDPIRTNRLSWVDYARGIAIILVVYRHVVIGLQRSGRPVANWLFLPQDVLMNFRMPVFFLLSGVFLQASLVRRPVFSVGRDRAFTLLYPYLVWASVTILLQILFSGFANEHREWSDFKYLVTRPRDLGPFWYLLALFNTSLLFLALRKLLVNPWIHLLLAAALHIFSTLPQIQHLSLLTDLSHYYLYLFLGTVISTILLDSPRSSQLLAFQKMRWLLPVFVAGQIVWYLNKDSASLLWLPVFFLINLVGCLFIYILSARLSQSHAARGLAAIGRYSLYIYVLHIFVASAVRTGIGRLVPDTPVWLVALVCILTGVGVPVLLIRLFRPFGAEWFFTLKPRKAT